CSLSLDTPPPPTSPLFPYTTLFRSVRRLLEHAAHHRERARSRGAHLRRPLRAHLRRPRSQSSPLISRRPGGFTASSSSAPAAQRSEEHTSELQSLAYLVCRLLLEKK